MEVIAEVGEQTETDIELDVEAIVRSNRKWIIFVVKKEAKVACLF